VTEKEAIETLQELSLERCEAFGFDCGNCDKCEVTIAYDMAIKALEKQIPKKHFKNECECIVDYEMLYTAINNKCKSKNCYCHNEYRIVLRNNYPTVCINRKRYYVHILIGEFIYGRIRKGYVIHHKDKNKLNAMSDNLELMTNRKHIKFHGEERKGIDYRSENGKRNSINAAVQARRRNDVTTEKVRELKNKGLTINEIAEELNCGINTVNRRLGMKDY
jgi:hypothetical protein